MCEETCDQENEEGEEEEEKETVSFHNGRHYNVEVESDCTKVHSASLPQLSPQANDSKRSKKTQLGLQSELDFLHAHFPSENRGHITDDSDCTKVHSASLPQPSPQASDSKRSKKTQLGLQSEVDFLHAHFPSENRGHITDDRTKQSCNEVIDHTTSHEDRTEQTHVEPPKTDESSQCLSVEQFYSSSNKRTS